MPGIQNSCGATPYRNDALVATAVAVRISEGQVMGYHFWNPSNAVAFVHFYDAASAAAVTVGTTVPKFTIAVPQAGGTDNPVTKVGIGGFASGIVVAATTTQTTAGTTAPSSGLLANIYVS